MAPEGGLGTARAVLRLASGRSMESPPLPAWGSQAKPSNLEVALQRREVEEAFCVLETMAPHYHLLSDEDWLPSGPAHRPTSLLAPP